MAAIAGPAIILAQRPGSFPAETVHRQADGAVADSENALGAGSFFTKLLAGLAGEDSGLEGQEQEQSPESGVMAAFDPSPDLPRLRVMTTVDTAVGLPLAPAENVPVPKVNSFDSKSISGGRMSAKGAAREPQVGGADESELPTGAMLLIKGEVVPLVAPAVAAAAAPDEVSLANTQAPNLSGVAGTPDTNALPSSTPDEEMHAAVADVSPAKVVSGNITASANVEIESAAHVQFKSEAAADPIPPPATSIAREVAAVPLDNFPAQEKNCETTVLPQANSSAPEVRAANPTAVAAPDPGRAPSSPPTHSAAKQAGKPGRASASTPRKSAGNIVAQVLALSGQAPRTVESIAPVAVPQEAIRVADSVAEPAQQSSAPAPAPTLDTTPERPTLESGPRVTYLDAGSADRDEVAFAVRMQAVSSAKHDVVPTIATQSAPNSAARPLPVSGSTMVAPAAPKDDGQPESTTTADAFGKLEPAPQQQPSRPNAERAHLPSDRQSQDSSLAATDSQESEATPARPNNATTAPGAAASTPVRDGRERRPATADPEGPLPSDGQQPKTQTHSLPITEVKADATKAPLETVQPQTTNTPSTLELDPKPENTKSEPVRDVKFEVTGGDRRVEVRLSERGGEVKLTVRTPDAPLASTLRENLPALSARLSETGIKSEAWHPAAASASEWRNTPEASQSSASQDDNSQPRQQDREPQGDGQQRRQHHPTEPVTQKQKGKDFAWLMSSLR